MLNGLFNNSALFCKIGPSGVPGHISEVPGSRIRGKNFVSFATGKILL